MTLKLDYNRWKREHLSYLSSLSPKKILLLFTGGKDSSIILDFMLKARSEFSLNFRVQSAKFPNMCFPAEEVAEIDKYWKDRGISIEWFEIDAKDNDLEKALQNGLNPCTVCQSIKYEFMKSKITELYSRSDPLVITYGFNLFDLVSYSLEYLLGAKYNNSSTRSFYQGGKIKSRFENLLSSRFYPFSKTNHGPASFYPLLKYNDFEINEVVKQKELPLIKTVCQYRKYTPKRIMSEVYETFGMNFDYDKVVNFAVNSFNLNDHIFSKDKYYI